MANISKLFGILNPDALEQLRQQGVSDDVIADNMAQTSPNFANQLGKIRRAYGADPSATTAFLNTRFLGTAEHAPEKPKGILARSLDRIYGNWKKDMLDIETSLQKKQQGEQGLVDTAIQVAGNLGSIGFSPVSQPFQEVAETGIRQAANIPGVSEAVQGIAESEIFQKGVIPAAQKTSDFLSEEAERNPALRSLGAIGEAAFDAGDFVGGGFLGKQALRGTKGAIRLAPQAPRLAGKAVGTTLRAGTAPIRQGFRGIREGFTGIDDAARAAKGAVQEVTEEVAELSPLAKQAVGKGVDEKVVRFIQQQTPETKSAMSAMTKAAQKGSDKLGGDVVHKELLGQYIMQDVEHLLKTKETVGKALGAMKKTISNEVIDLTDDFDEFMMALKAQGAVINEKGKITAIAGVADDNIPMLQKTLDWFSPNEAGAVTKTFKDIDLWRSKMFQEMNSAKAKLAPSASGKSVFGFAERLVNNIRRNSLVGTGNTRLIAYNDAFEEISTEVSKFLKAIQYKGKLTADEITSKALRSGEVSLRTLGNASANIRDDFRSMLELARKYGFDSGVDEMSLVRWADTLEDIFPIAPTRSLRGEVSRATRDAAGNLIEDVVTAGPRKGVGGAISEKILQNIEKLRGMTPENRTRLLLDLMEDNIDDVGLLAKSSTSKSAQSQLKSILDSYDIPSIDDIDFDKGVSIASAAKKTGKQLGDIDAMDIPSIRKSLSKIPEGQGSVTVENLRKELFDAQNSLSTADDALERFEEGFRAAIVDDDIEAVTILTKLDNLVENGFIRYDDVVDEQGTTLQSLINEYTKILDEKAAKRATKRAESSI